jgi:hypothetical protein
MNTMLWYYEVSLGAANLIRLLPGSDGATKAQASAGDQAAQPFQSLLKLQQPLPMACLR